MELEIFDLILLLALAIVCIASYLTIQYYRDAYYEMIDVHLNDCKKIETAVNSGSFDRMLNVKDFNEWFNSDKDKEIYAHPGIFLRLDKLSQHHIQDFIKAKSNDVINYEHFDERTLINFEGYIRKDWIKKRNKL